MSLCQEGLKGKLKSTNVSIAVKESDALIQLANHIDWEYLSSIVMADLKATTVKGL